MGGQFNERSTLPPAVQAIRISMKKLFSTLACLGLSLGLGLGTAQAQDAVIGGEVGLLTPSQPGPITLKELDVKVERTKYKKRNAWKVTATYALENTSDASASVELHLQDEICGMYEEFGDEFCTGFGKNNGEYNFAKIETSITHRAGASTGTIKTPKAKTIEIDKGDWEVAGLRYSFPLKLKAKDSAQVVQTYYLGVSGNSMQEHWLEFDSGRLSAWGKPIDKASFEVLFDERPWGFSFNEEYQLKSYVTHFENGTSKTALQFVQSNWKPKHRLALQFPTPRTVDLSLLGIDYCPPIEEIDDYDEDFANEPGVPNVFDPLNKEQLQVCRNLPYAAHGLQFKTARLSKLFYQGPKKAKDHDEGGQLTIIHFQPNENYNAAALTPIERHYIKRVQIAEKKLKAK